ncbi:MAG: hypothetical protein K9M82_10530, partial [Deltaproteobacteria bacterium]|nr:hypothetical protein [Deltaproteobacteria bacterium]
MILNPAVIALLTVSGAGTLFALYGSTQAVRILRHWDLASGSELQLELERKTYLISTIMGWVAAFELASLFLFAHTADRVHTLFVGAMCAAGSLNVNDYGYPALVLKMAVFTACGVWLIVNAADNRGYDYPLIRTKYRLLLILTGLMLLETVFLFQYFAGLRADVITSCCGTLFSQDAESVGGDMASLPSYGAKVVFFTSMGLTLRTGLHVLITRSGARLFSLVAGWSMLFCLLAVVSFVSVHYYELPTHHCRFCRPQGDYHFIGYPMYLSLLLGGVSGLSVGLLERVKGPESLSRVNP